MASLEVLHFRGDALEHLTVFDFDKMIITCVGYRLVTGRPSPNS